MHVRGNVALVHPNGRIVYEGTPETRADGLELGSKVHLADRMHTAGKHMMGAKSSSFLSYWAKIWLAIDARPNVSGDNDICEKRT